MLPSLHWKIKYSLYALKETIVLNKYLPSWSFIDLWVRSVNSHQILFIKQKMVSAIVWLILKWYYFALGLPQTWTSLYKDVYKQIMSHYKM